MRKNPKTTDDVNLKPLTPLISALLLAAIKLALEEKKKAKTCKPTTTKASSRRHKTI